MMWDGDILGFERDKLEWVDGNDGYEYALTYGLTPWWAFWRPAWDWMYLKRKKK